MNWQSINVMIGTPCYGGLLHYKYAQGILELQKKAQELNFKIETAFYVDSLINRARNAIVYDFLNSDCTHLFFIDGDIEFDVEAILKVISFDKPIACSAIPLKFLNYDAIKAYPDKLINENFPENIMLYNFNVEDSEEIIREGDFIKVIHCGTAFMCIQRDVFFQFQEAYPEMEFHDARIDEQSKQFKRYKNFTYFETFIDPDTKVYLSEDYGFCKRWIDIGGEIWVDLNSKFKHYGSHGFKGHCELSILKE